METDVSSMAHQASEAIVTLQQLLATCMDAFGEDEEAPKVSATTKKRLTARAMQGLQGGTQLVQALAANMRELQQAVQQQQEGMQQAMHSNQTLQQQLVGSNDECHSSKRALLQSESQKMGLQQQVEHLQRQLHLATAEKQELQGTIQELQAELQGAAQQAADARMHLVQLHQQMEQLAAATREAEAGADAAAGALQAAREQADKEQAARVRHEDAVALLTADNLVFLAHLRAAEAGAAAAVAERDELKLALEQHKGPWMDEVHQGVELRVKAAMARAEQLEAQQELAAAQHAQHTQQLQQQQADLEAALQEERQRAADLQAQLEAAQAAASEDRAAAEEAAVLAATAEAAADERAAELRVAQESLRSMREECNERWMSERDARTQLVELQERLDSRDAAVAKLRKQLQSRSDDLATQRAVNQQLMLKKEEVEWQLLAAIAQLHTHQAGAASGSPKSISPQESLETKQQAATAAAVSQAAAAPGDSLLSPFVASALLPLSPVHRSPVAQHAAMSIPPPAAAGLRVSTGGGATTHAAPTAAQQPAAAAAAAEVPGPAAVAAGGALWQLPGGSSSGLFGSRVSSSGGAVHPLAALNPMPAATAAAVGALFGNQADGLHHAFSAPEGDMYSLPRLGFGLATLPSPEQMFAAAEAAASGSGSLQKTVTIGRAGSLTVPMSAADAAGPGSSSSSGGGSASADGGAAPAPTATGPPGSTGLGFLNITREGRTSSGGPGSVTFKPPASVQPILLGTTGGLMAPFSTLLPANAGPSSSGGRGAVFPECITASAVTDIEQLELGCFGFSAGLTDALQQHPGFWYLQAQQQHQQHQQQQPSHQRHGSSGSLSDGGHHSSSPCGSSSGSLHEEGQQQHQHAGSRSGAAGAAAYKPPAVPHPAAAIVGSGADAAAAGSGFAAAPAGDAPAGSAAAAEGRGSNDSQESKDEGMDSNASSNAQLHGILINGRSSRSRSPLTGVSPSGSMKSVRFSFEGIENASTGGARGVLAADGDQELPGDQRVGRRSGSSSARRSVSPPTNRGSHGHSGSEWLRQTLYDQLATHSPAASHGASPRGAAVGSAGSGSSLHGGGHHADYHSSSSHHQQQQHSSSSPGGSYGHQHHQQGYDPYAARRQHHSSGGGSVSSSRHGHGWPVSSHPPRSGLHLMGRFADGRHGRSVQDMIRQQQRQVRQQQVAKEVAAMAAAVKDRAQPKAPVHPIFGVMHAAGDSGSGQQQQPAA